MIDPNNEKSPELPCQLPGIYLSSCSSVSRSTNAGFIFPIPILSSRIQIYGPMHALQPPSTGGWTRRFCPGPSEPKRKASTYCKFLVRTRKWWEDGLRMGGTGRPDFASAERCARNLLYCTRSLCLLQYTQPSIINGVVRRAWTVCMARCEPMRMSFLFRSALRSGPLTSCRKSGPQSQGFSSREATEA